MRFAGRTVPCTMAMVVPRCGKVHRERVPILSAPSGFVAFVGSLLSAHSLTNPLADELTNPRWRLLEAACSATPSPASSGPTSSTTSTALLSSSTKYSTRFGASFADSEAVTTSPTTTPSEQQRQSIHGTEASPCRDMRILRVAVFLRETVRLQICSSRHDRGA